MRSARRRSTLRHRYGHAARKLGKSAYVELAEQAKSLRTEIERFFRPKGDSLADELGFTEPDSKMLVYKAEHYHAAVKRAWLKAEGAAAEALHAAKDTAEAIVNGLTVGRTVHEHWIGYLDNAVASFDTLAKAKAGHTAGLSAAERAALERLAAGYGFKREGSMWQPTGGPAIGIANGVMQRLARRGFVTFVGAVPGTVPAITEGGRGALG